MLNGYCKHSRIVKCNPAYYFGEHRSTVFCDTLNGHKHVLRWFLCTICCCEKNLYTYSRFLYQRKGSHIFVLAADDAHSSGHGVNSSWLVADSFWIIHGVPKLLRIIYKRWANKSARSWLQSFDLALLFLLLLTFRLIHDKCSHLFWLYCNATHHSTLKYWSVDLDRGLYGWCNIYSKGIGQIDSWHVIIQIICTCQELGIMHFTTDSQDSYFMFGCELLWLIWDQ